MTIYQLSSVRRRLDSSKLNGIMTPKTFESLNDPDTSKTKTNEQQSIDRAVYAASSGLSSIRNTGNTVPKNVVSSRMINIKKCFC